MKVAFLTLLSIVTLQASQYALVIKGGSHVSALSTPEVKKIYLMKKHFINTTKIIPINLPSSHTIRQKFNTRVLKMDPNRLNRYWTKQHFQGIHPPLVQPSVQAVKKFVQNVQGAVGYIPKQNVDATLEVLYEF